jgi:GNAT superfamily N-acetyltransferase
MSTKKKQTKKNSNPDTLQVHITHLEMTAPLLKLPPVPTKPSIALMRAQNIPADYYSYLYEKVGKPHHWEERRALAPDKLSSIINDDSCEISILYAEGCPAGFFELNLSDMPTSIEIKYLGLANSYQGLKLGKWFVATAISSAWAHKPEKIKIETNTLDHPAALRIYQQLGFTPVAVDEAKITPWL